MRFVKPVNGEMKHTLGDDGIIKRCVSKMTRAVCRGGKHINSHVPSPSSEECNARLAMLFFDDTERNGTGRAAAHLTDDTLMVEIQKRHLVRTSLLITCFSVWNRSPSMMQYCVSEDALLCTSPMI